MEETMRETVTLTDTFPSFGHALRWAESMVEERGFRLVDLNIEPMVVVETSTGNEEAFAWTATLTGRPPTS